MGEKDLLDGEKHDPQVHKPGGIFDIIQIILKFFLAVLYAVAVGVVDLRPAGQTGADGVAKIIVGDEYYPLTGKNTPTILRVVRSNVLSIGRLAGIRRKRDAFVLSHGRSSGR